MQFHSIPSKIAIIVMITTLLTSSMIISKTMAMIKKNAYSDTYVYYGYVPPSTDIGDQVVELINGTYYNYTPPSGTALLDILGLEDNAHFKVIDLSTRMSIVEGRVDKLKKFTYFIPHGTFFKVVSDKRVLVHLCGGSEYLSMGAYGFYPSVKGGFRGKEFIIIPETIYYDSVNILWTGRNLLLMGLSKGDFEVRDSINKWSTKGSLDQHAVKDYFGWARRYPGTEDIGPGYSMIFYVKSSGDIQIAAATTGGFTAVPAVTGGFVGKLFFCPVYIGFAEAGITASLVIVPLEPCEVVIYDNSLNEIARKKFSDSDIEKDAFWFYPMGNVKRFIIIKSSGDVTVLAGTTYGSESPEYLGDDITFIGARPNQFIKFYAPTSAVLFTIEDTNVIIDGVKRYLKADSYILLDRGVHSVKADKLVIIEILGVSTGWDSWGSYLISPIDIMASFEVPEGFGEKKGGINIIMITSIVAIVVVAVTIIIKRIRGRGKV